jgi:signal peptidase II
MNLSLKLRLTLMLLILGCTVGCDQTTKHIARAELGERRFIVLPGGLGEFRQTENPGSFLSFGDSLPKTLRQALFTFFVGAGLLGLLLYLAFGCRLNRWLFIGLGLICAGGIGNLIDRITHHGLVSDFIFIRAGPFHTGVFNLADIAIMAGGAVVACDFLTRRRIQGQQR